MVQLILEGTQLIGREEPGGEGGGGNREDLCRRGPEIVQRRMCFAVI